MSLLSIVGLEQSRRCACAVWAGQDAELHDMIKGKMALVTGSTRHWARNRASICC
jgi:hypothetical protein